MTTVGPIVAFRAQARCSHWLKVQQSVGRGEPGSKYLVMDEIIPETNSYHFRDKSMLLSCKHRMHVRV